MINEIIKDLQENENYYIIAICSSRFNAQKEYEKFYDLLESNLNLAITVPYFKLGIENGSTIKFTHHCMFCGEFPDGIYYVNKPTSGPDLANCVMLKYQSRFKKTYND